MVIQMHIGLLTPPRPAPTDALSALHFSALYDDTSGEIRVMQPKIQAAASLHPHFIPGGTFKVISKYLKFAKIEVWKEASQLDSRPLSVPFLFRASGKGTDLTDKRARLACTQRV